jgi:hypothetical protein
MIFKKRKNKINFEGGGLILFDAVESAIATEKILIQAGYSVRLVVPPPEKRKGCDLAVEININEQLGIERLLNEKEMYYIGIEPVKTGTAPLLDIVKITDFDKWVMVKAGNMKITYEKETGTIVNISGGGCPDIPYLYIQMVDKKLYEVPRPKDIGFTLCALNLDRALDECLALYSRRQQI